MVQSEIKELIQMIDPLYEQSKKESAKDMYSWLRLVLQDTLLNLEAEKRENDMLREMLLEDEDYC